MDIKTKGTVVSVSRQWWLKVNTKIVRVNTFDGATFPHIIKVKYTADGNDYFKRKWISAGAPVPQIGNGVTVIYSENKPSKGKIDLSNLLSDFCGD